MGDRDSRGDEVFGQNFVDDGSVSSVEHQLFFDRDLSLPERLLLRQELLLVVAVSDEVQADQLLGVHVDDDVGQFVNAVGRSLSHHLLVEGLHPLRERSKFVGDVGGLGAWKHSMALERLETSKMRCLVQKQYHAPTAFISL